MARQMEFTDCHGTTHPASYWTFDSIEIKPLDRIGRARFAGWASKESLDAGKEPLREAIEASCDGERFDALKVRHFVDKVDIGTLCYELADEQGKFPKSKEV